MLYKGNLLRKIQKDSPFYISTGENNRKITEHTTCFNIIQKSDMENPCSRTCLHKANCDGEYNCYIILNFVFVTNYYVVYFWKYVINVQLYMYVSIKSILVSLFSQDLHNFQNIGHVQDLPEYLYQPSQFIEKCSNMYYVDRLQPKIYLF